MAPPIVDAHLDMAMNVLVGRDYDSTAADLRAVEQRQDHQVMVTLPELKRGGVAVAFGTLYVGTVTYDADLNPVYETPPDITARKQLDVYRSWFDTGRARPITDRESLESHLTAWEQDGVLGLVILIEGGDSILSPDHLREWWDAGVRLIGPAWSRTRYCGGTNHPGGLTPMGRELLQGMKELGCILDISHMAEQAFWESLEVGFSRVVATHANVRALVPTHRPDRHLSDEMMQTLRQHDGVMGVVPANAFLDDSQWGVDRSGPPLRLDVVRKHLEHMASILGWERVGIGSDLDGGFGVEESPVELDSIADLSKIGDLVPAHARDGVLGGNWLRVLRESLPGRRTGARRDPR